MVAFNSSLLTASEDERQDDKNDKKFSEELFADPRWQSALVTEEMIMNGASSEERQVLFAL